MAADEGEIEKLRGEEKEKLKVCMSKPLLVLHFVFSFRDTGSCLICLLSTNILLDISVNNQGIFVQ